jgi:circadian clock protein KaiB
MREKAMSTASEASARKTGREPEYRMTLFVAGDEPNSRKARTNIIALCDAELGGRCELRIVDVLEEFAEAASSGVVVTPTLLVHAPGPESTVIGSLEDEEKLRTALKLHTGEA